MFNVRRCSLTVVCCLLCVVVRCSVVRGSSVRVGGWLLFGAVYRCCFSLFVVRRRRRCLLFVIWCLVFVGRCSFSAVAVRCLLCVSRRLLLVECSSAFGMGCCLLLVIRCWILCVACCACCLLLVVVSCLLLVVVCSSLIVVRCALSLFGVCCV